MQDALTPGESAEPSLSPPQRAVAVFVRPHQAWGGLKTHAQWWFPLLILVVLSLGLAALLHDRAVMPMLRDTWGDQVANGQMEAAQADRMEKMMSGPTGLMFTLIQQLIIIPLIYLFTSMVLWFGVSFLLGRKMPFRWALEVVCWSGLVTIPAQLLTLAIAWTRETMRGVHVGFGILLPEAETPSRLSVGLGVLLDALGPLSIWYLIVLILGAAALSGAPRKTVAWVVGGLYLAMVVLFAALGALFTPGT
jgi:hypothetical protein